MKKQTAENYHHGELREACLKEGLKLLKAKGVEAVTMREIAARAGVSPRAPYRHFADRLALLAALAEDGFRRFTDSMRFALAEAGAKNRKARFLALATAYIDFAIQNPDLIELMFSEMIRSAPAHYPEFLSAAADALKVLTDETEALSKESGYSADQLTISAWALVHGYASLAKQRAFHRLRSDDLKDVDIRSMVELFFRGVKKGGLRDGQ